MPSIKDFILKKAKSWNYKQARKNWRRRKKLVEVKWFTNGILKRMIFENLQQYVLWVIELWNLLLICTWQMINKTIWQSILKYIKQDKTTTKLWLIKVKEDILNSALALLKGREMVLKAFESVIFLRSEQSENQNN